MPDAPAESGTGGSDWHAMDDEQRRSYLRATFDVVVGPTEPRSRRQRESVDINRR